MRHPSGQPTRPAATSQTNAEELAPDEIDVMMAEAKALDEYFQRAPFALLRKHELEKMLADCLEPTVPPPVS